MSKLAVNFFANVSEATARDLINWVSMQIAQQNPQDPYDELVIQVSSPGGSSDHGMLLYNFLKQLPFNKTTIGMGNVDSAAIMLFLAGDKRLAVPSCRFVLHEARATINGEFNSTKLAELANITKRITQDYVGVVADITKKTKISIANKVRNGVVLSSDEAKKLGLVQQVTGKPYFGPDQQVKLFIITNPPIVAQQAQPYIVPMQPQLPLMPRPDQNNPQIII